MDRGGEDREEKLIRTSTVRFTAAVCQQHSHTVGFVWRIEKRSYRCVRG